MIPPVKQEAAAMVAIAPTPSTQHLDSAIRRDQLRCLDNQSNMALEIMQQPPETWYKDQYGRKATFEIQVTRTETFCGQCVEQRILSLQLLYESGKVVEKQEILHVMSGQCLDKHRQSVLAVRIAEVSKNHLNQRFRVQISVPRCPGSCDYDTSVVSDPVLVLSKKKKRPVKQNAETEVSPAKTKKAKRIQETPKRKLPSESPDSSQSSTATIRDNVTAAIAEMEEAIPPSATESIAPFTPDTPNLCLWANAAFDLLYKLQWQRVPTSSTENPEANLDEILAQAMSKAYKCPSCQETYGQVPAHRDDCDLKLLLEQGQPEVPSRRADNSKTTLRWPSDKNFGWPERPKAMYSGGDVTPKIQVSPYNLSQDLLHLSGAGSGQTSTKGFDFAEAAVSLNSWKDYASLSKLLYSTSYLDGKPPQAGTALNPTLQWTGVLPPVGTLSPGFPTLPSAMKSSTISQNVSQHGMGSQRLSALLSATKGMSSDAADLFRESEAALHGDGNIVSSLSNLSVSDLIRSSSVDVENDSRLDHSPISLSALLSGDQPVLDMSLEKGVRVIMASDFRDCGFPAFDASFNLVGFYHLLTPLNNNPAELRFTPNMFPFPQEMMQELEDTIATWKGNPSVCYQGEWDENSEDSLIRLKSAVLHEVMR